MLHRALGCRPWEWPCIEYPDAECPYPEGCVAAPALARGPRPAVRGLRALCHARGGGWRGGMTEGEDALADRLRDFMLDLRGPEPPARFGSSRAFCARLGRQGASPRRLRAAVMSRRFVSPRARRQRSILRKVMTMAEQTTLSKEVEDLVTRLVRAGVPPALVGLELMSMGASLLLTSMGAECLQKQCAAIASTVEQRAAMH